MTDWLINLIQRTNEDVVDVDVRRHRQSTLNNGRYVRSLKGLHLLKHQFRLFLVFEAGKKLRLDNAWRDERHLDWPLLSAQLSSKSLGQSAHGKLGGRVEVCLWAAGQSVTGHGADVEDVPLGNRRLGHQLHRFASHNGQTEDVYLQHQAPVISVTGSQWRGLRQTGVIDANVQSAKLGFDQTEDIKDGRLIAHIALNGRKRAGGGSAWRRNRLSNFG